MGECLLFLAILAYVTQLCYKIYQYMNEEYLDGFRKIFSEYSDEDILSLLKEGDMSFDENAWKLLNEEAEKRSIIKSPEL